MPGKAGFSGRRPQEAPPPIGPSFDYWPPPTLDLFLGSNAFARFAIGPFGSGKTTCMIMESLRRAAQQAPGPDGIRRTRAAIVRNTLPQLRTTILPDIRGLLSGIVDYYVSESTIRIIQGDIFSEWLFIPLDNVEDVRRLLSTQLTWAWLAEFRELDYEIVAAIMGRVGRYPSRLAGGPSWYGVFGESNPFDLDSPWYHHLVEQRPDTWELYVQPGGRSSEAENVENLPDNYYDRLCEGHDLEWISVHVDGNYGTSKGGQAVFKHAFSRTHHVSKSELLVNSELPLLIGLDFGRTPTAVLGQHDAWGRYVVFDEVLSDDMGLTQFLREKLIPRLASPRFQGMRYAIIGDPAGSIKGQVEEDSPFDCLKKEGFDAIPAPTNDVEARVLTMEALLLKTLSVGPAFLIDPRCSVLIRAFAGEYRYPKTKITGIIKDKPEKRHPASDAIDACTYFIMGSTSRRASSRIFQRRKVWEDNAAPPIAAWT